MAFTMTLRRAAPFVAVLLMVSCKSGGSAGIGSREAASTPVASRVTTPADASMPMEQAAKLMSNPVIDIEPGSNGTAGTVFRFRFRDPADVGVEIPLVSSIALDKVGDQRPACMLKSPNAVRLAEWKYGDVPTGFEKTGCAPLTAGEYEIYVTGIGGRGTGRMRIDENGHVNRLPWFGEEDSAARRR